jgi:hypothetical protein
MAQANTPTGEARSAATRQAHGVDDAVASGAQVTCRGRVSRTHTSLQFPLPCASSSVPSVVCVSACARQPRRAQTGLDWMALDSWATEPVVQSVTLSTALTHILLSLPACAPPLSLAVLCSSPLCVLCSVF